MDTFSIFYLYTTDFLSTSQAILLSFLMQMLRKWRQLYNSPYAHTLTTPSGLI